MRRFLLGVVHRSLLFFISTFSLSSSDTSLVFSAASTVFVLVSLLISSLYYSCLSVLHQKLVSFCSLSSLFSRPFVKAFMAGPNAISCFITCIGSTFTTIQAVIEEMCIHFTIKLNYLTIIDNISKLLLCHCYMMDTCFGIASARTPKIPIFLRA